jgi:hypothetical protein
MAASPGIVGNLLHQFWREAAKADTGQAAYRTVIDSCGRIDGHRVADHSLCGRRWWLWAEGEAQNMQATVRKLAPFSVHDFSLCRSGSGSDLEAALYHTPMYALSL